MANFTTPITRTLNKEFKGRLGGLRIQASAPGSFLAVRVDDLEGVVTLKLFSDIVRRASTLWVEAGLDHTLSVNPTVSYFADGCVANWVRY